MLNFDVITNGEATTECQSMIDSLTIDLGPQLTDTNLSILKCYSAHSDHANTADKASTLFGEAKTQSWEGVSDQQKAEMTVHDQKVAAVFKKRHCGQHLVNILSANYIGSKKKADDDEAHPDKSQMTHGLIEYSVLARLCAADILSRHIDIAAGRRGLRVPQSRIHLVRWGFQKMRVYYYRLIY